MIVLLIFSRTSRGVPLLEVFTPPGLETLVRAVVLAPVCEEMFFRGYYQPKCESRFGRKPGLFLTASLFAIIHIPNMLPQYFARPLTIEGLLIIFILGLLFGAVRDETGSVYYPIVFHALWNYVL
ncbi:MAG: CPBP family intramembrane metalloprotease [Thaumarchaeota archaeon]|nr:CPBP family intramembrane metalloprotease [Nitrososphaerota archaeon]